MQVKGWALALVFSCAGSVWSMDEYLPIRTGTSEFDIGYGAVFYDKVYDADGESQAINGFDPMVNVVNMQVKIGLLRNLEASFAWQFLKANEDAGDYSGLTQPEAGVKYALIPGTLAVYGNLIFPFVTGDFDTDPLMFSFGMEPGVVFGFRSETLRLDGRVAYTVYTENSDDYKDGDAFYVLLKPGLIVNDKFDVYLGVEYLNKQESEGFGMGLGNDRSLSVIMPGLTYALDKQLTFEANVPVTLAGKKAPGGWGLSASLYYTISRM